MNYHYIQTKPFKWQTGSALGEKITLVGMHLKISPIYLSSIVLEQNFSFSWLQRSNFPQTVNAALLLINGAKENETWLVQLW